MRGRALRSVLFLLALGMLIAATACRKRDSAERAKVLAPRPEPVRPREVVAELVVPRPAELWEAVRKFVGGPTEFLPSSPELAAAGLIGLDALSAGSLDFRSPCAGALVLDNAADPALVLAFRVQSGVELVARLSTGNAPTHQVRTEGELNLLSRTGSDAPASLAVVGDAVLVGPRAALSKAGVYVARGALLRPPSPKPHAASIVVFGDALREVVAKALRARWVESRRELELAQEREKAVRNRAADFADPRALLFGAEAVIESVLAVLESNAGIHAELDLTPTALSLRARITPKRDGAAKELGAGLALGNGSPLGLLPDTAGIGLLLRRRLSGIGDAGAASSGSPQALRSLFGSRLGEAEERALREIADAIDQGRGDEQVLSLMSGKSIQWRGTVRDSASFRRGLSGAFKVIARPPLLPVFQELFGQPSVTSQPVQVPGLPANIERTLLSFSPSPAERSKGKAETRIELLSQVDAQRFLLVAAESARSGLEAALRAENGERNLAHSPLASALLSQLEQVSLALFVDFSKLGVFRATGEAPAVFSFGARQGIPEAWLGFSHPALRALMDYGIRR